MSVAQSASGAGRVEPFGGGGGSGGVPQKPAAVKPTVSNRQLESMLDKLYRGARSESRVGDGTTADAVRNERLTGRPTADAYHTKKANDTVRFFRNWLRKNKDAAQADRDVAQREYDNLLDALGRTNP